MKSLICPGCHLDKGKLPVVDYTFEFQTLSAACGWKVPSLLDTFHHSLSIAIMDQLFSVEHPADLSLPWAARLTTTWESERVHLQIPQNRYPIISCGGVTLWWAGRAHVARVRHIIFRRITATPAGGQVHILWSTGPIPGDLSNKRPALPLERWFLVSWTISPNCESCPLTEVELLSPVLSIKVNVLIDSIVA